MADETYTKEQLDKAIETAVAKVQESVDRLEAKNAELVGDLRKARKAGEIKPEDLTAAEERADKAEAALADVTKQLKSMTAERDKAVKALETEQGAARTNFLEAEIASAIAAGNVIPTLVPALTALAKQQDAKVEMTDGKYAATIAGKPVKDYFAELFSSEEGKVYRSASVNSGGGAPGSDGKANSARTMTREAFSALSPAEQMSLSREGVNLVDA